MKLVLAGILLVLVSICSVVFAGDTHDQAVGELIARIDRLKLKKKALAAVIELENTILQNVRQEAGPTKGVVKWFNDSAGYGYITLGNGGDVFVHFSAISDISDDGFKTLKEGDTVTLEVVDGPKGSQAANVSKMPVSSTTAALARSSDADRSVQKKLDEEHEKARGGGYDKEFHEAIKKNGGARLKKAWKDNCNAKPLMKKELNCY